MREPSLDLDLIRARAQDLRTSDPSPQTVFAYLHPGIDPTKHARIYRIGRDIVIGNGHHRLLALYIAKIELPACFQAENPDDELRDILLPGVHAFREKFKVDTVAMFARTHLNDLVN